MKKRERDIDEISNSNSVKKVLESSNILDFDLLSKEIAEIIANNDGKSKDEIDSKLSTLLLRAIKERKLDCVEILLSHKVQVFNHYFDYTLFSFN